MAALEGGKCVREQWEFFRCECGRQYAVLQVQGDELEEPACPECGETNSQTIGEVSVVDKRR
jgi:predicted nucleic acid-binding Zn ribbon protein